MSPKIDRKRQMVFIMQNKGDCLTINIQCRDCEYYLFCCTIEQEHKYSISEFNKILLAKIQEDFINEFGIEEYMEILL